VLGVPPLLQGVIDFCAGELAVTVVAGVAANGRQEPCDFGNVTIVSFAASIRQVFTPVSVEPLVRTPSSVVPGPLDDGVTRRRTASKYCRSPVAACSAETPSTAWSIVPMRLVVFTDVQSSPSSW